MKKCQWKINFQVMCMNIDEKHNLISIQMIIAVVIGAIRS